MAKKKETISKKSAPKKSTTKKSPAKKVIAAKPARKQAVKAVSKTAKAKTAKAKTSKPASKAAPKTAKVSAKTVKTPIQLLADAAVEGILELKGRNISVLDLTGMHNRVCDYYIICQADSNTQVKAIAGSVQTMVKKRIGENPYRSEGFENSEWVLVDYVTVVVHVFQTHIRNFYNLESLWADAEVTEIAFD